MANFFFIKDSLKNHIYKNKYIYFLVVLSFIVGVIVGVLLTLTSFKTTSLLTSGDKNLYNYITGDAKYINIFTSRLYNLIFCFLIIFVFNLSIYTSIFSYLFLSYQTALVVLSSSAIISVYGLSGVFNVILFLIPMNLLNLFVLALYIIISSYRASLQKKYRLSLISSFKEENYFSKTLLCFAIGFIVCIINSFIIPVLIKSCVIINY